MPNTRKRIKAKSYLSNALKRKDIKAVQALLAKGADPDSVQGASKSAREVAQELKIGFWLQRKSLHRNIDSRCLSFDKSIKPS